MNDFLKKCTLLFLGVCAFFPPSLTATEKDSNRKDINWSIHIDKNQDQIKTTLFNLGVISNLNIQKGLGVNLLYSAIHEQMYGLQLSGVLGYAQNADGVQVGGLANFTKNNASGLMLSGLMNASGGMARGFQFAGITNISGKNMDGLALAGLMNVSTDTMNGVQLSTLLNASGRELNGVQLSLLSNVGARITGVQSSFISNIAAEQMNGLQFAGVANIAYTLDRGMQFSSLANVCLDNMNGVQMALGNYAENVEGTQIGLLNLSTGKVNGWQVGIVNHSKDTTAHKIGLVNVTPKTKIQAMIFGSNTSKINIAVRFKNRTNYSILGVGTHYLDLNDDFSGCLFYRTGLYFPIRKRFEISGDVGYFHIENFEDENVNVPDRMYSIQGRLNLSYRLLPKLSLFASTGYAMTRYYKKNKLFENKGIIEGGIILF